MSVDPQVIRDTPPGMAHWMGTGPAGKTCRECTFFDADGHDAAGMLKAARCKKHTALMNGRQGPKIKHANASCRFFHENLNPPMPHL